jgi:hypothetical protein
VRPDLRCIFLIGLCDLMPPGWVSAATLQGLQVDQRENLFRLHLLAHVQAPFGSTWGTLTDYPNLYRLTPAVKLSEVLGQDPDGSTLVRTRSRVCVWIFCKTLQLVQRMRQPALGRLEAVTVPRLSDFAYGHTSWHLAPEGDGTRFELRTELRPVFWVPPLVGPMLIEQGLKDSALQALEGLERESRPPR